MDDTSLVWAELVSAIARLDSLEAKQSVSGKFDPDPFFNIDPGLGSFLQEDPDTRLIQPFMVMPEGQQLASSQDSTSDTSAQKAEQNWFNIRRGQVIVGGVFYTHCISESPTSPESSVTGDIERATIADLSAAELTGFEQFRPGIDELTDGGAATAIDVWVEVDFKQQVWRLRARKQDTLGTSEWTNGETSVAGDVTMGIFPIATVNGVLAYTGGKANINPLNLVQHHLGDLQITAPHWADPTSPIYFSRTGDGTIQFGNADVKLNWQANIHRYESLTAAEDDHGADPVTNGYFRNDTRTQSEELTLTVQSGSPPNKAQKIWVFTRDIHAPGAATGAVIKILADEGSPAFMGDDTHGGDDKWEWWEKVIEYTGATARTSINLSVPITALRFNVDSLAFFDRRHPDGEGVKSKQGSLDFTSTLETGSRGLLQLYKFDAGNTHSPVQQTDQVVFRIGSSAGRQVKYGTVADISYSTIYNSNYTNINWPDVYAYGYGHGYGYGYNPFIHNEHTRLDFTNSDPANNMKPENKDHDLRYLYSADHGTNTRGLYTTNEFRAPALRGTGALAIDSLGGTLTLTSTGGDIVQTTATNIFLNANVIDLNPTTSLHVNALPGHDGAIVFDDNAGGTHTFTFTHGVLTGHSVV